MHSMGILCRNIYPENILISITKPVQMKWSDFGSSKPVNEKVTSSKRRFRRKTENWMSPEELRMFGSEENVDHRRGSVKSEIFSAGCVFIFFLLRGKHPFWDQFGSHIIINDNIINDNPLNVKGS